MNYYVIMQFPRTQHLPSNSFCRDCICIYEYGGIFMIQLDPINVAVVMNSTNGL